jgi:hypothetical protein
MLKTMGAALLMAAILLGFAFAIYVTTKGFNDDEND